MPNDLPSTDPTTLAQWVHHHRNATLTRATLASIAVAQLALMAIPWWNFGSGENGRLPATVWLLASDEMSDEEGYTDVLNAALAEGPVIVFILALIVLGIPILSSRRAVAVVGAVGCVVAGVVVITTVTSVASIADERGDAVATTPAAPIAALLWFLAAAVAALAARWSGEEPRQ